MAFEGVHRVGHVGIWVSDIEKSLEWYRDVVGLKLTGIWGEPYRKHRMCFVRCEDWHHDIVFFEIDKEKDRSKLVWLWKIAGFLLGFLPTLFGPKIVFATIEAVEAFVEEHYEEQLKYLRAQSNPNQELIDLLQSCQDDEIDHKLESAEKKNLTPGIFINIWTKIVGGGSAFAVKVAKII